MAGNIAVLNIMIYENKKIWRKKVFWLFVLLMVILVFFIYFWLSKPEIIFEIFRIKRPSPEEWKFDNFEPSSQIKSPFSDSWQSEDFYIRILDEDLESGLNSASCAYKVLSYDESGQEYSSGWHQRKCNSSFGMSVGKNKWCGQEGRNSCLVYVLSKDKAGNQHEPSQEKGSVKYYNIDWSAPEVSRVSIVNSKAEVVVRDNLKVAGCNLYFDGKSLGVMSFLVPGCEKECRAVMDWNLKLEPGSHKVSAACLDAVGNFSKGEELLLKENQSPKVFSCRVQPVQGKMSTDFEFSSEFSDPDGDSLSFLWDFGDGNSSSEQTSIHRYSESGIFEPKIRVSDGRSGEDICSTAWVVVSQ